MKIARDSLTAFDFEGIGIRDYTAGLDASSSIAEITVPAGAGHKRAWSRRSDKFYFALEGTLSFTIDDRVVDLSPGDICIVARGTRFSYENNSGSVARVLLTHTPGFALEDEVFEE